MVLAAVVVVLAGLAPQEPEVEEARPDPVVAMLEGHTGHVARLSTDARGTVLASAGHDQTVRLWDVETWEQRVVLSASSQQFAVAVSPDGKLVAAAGDFVVRVWKLRKLPKQKVDDPFGPVAELKIPGGPGGAGGTVWDLAFSPDSKLLAGGTFDGTTILWDAKRWQKLAVLEGHTAVSDGSHMVEFVDWSPDGEMLLTGGKTGETFVWGIEGRGTRRKDRVLWRAEEKQEGPPAHRMCAAFAPGGERLAIGGTDGALWFAQRQKGEWSLARELTAHPGAYAHALAFTPDGSRLCSVGSDLRIWNPDDGELLRTIPLGGDAHEILVMPGGELAVVAEFDGPVKVVRIGGE